MTDTSDSQSHDDRLGEATEEIARRLAADEAIDIAELATRFGLAEAEIEGCVAALGAMDALVGAGPDDLQMFFDNDGPTAMLRPPSLPEDYDLGEEIGRGGMGIVYRARQRSLDRDVAVKVLRPGELTFGKAIARFQQEARSLARLRHPHIVGIHEVGQSDGAIWFSMDLIDGTSLSEVIKRGEVGPTRAVKILRQVASAVAYVHQHGLIHRDLKPQNILIDGNGDAFVTDFGLARDAGDPEQSGLTQTGQILGTPGYMSPEQARGRSDQIGEPADIYGLGAILYECLTGRAPFRGLSPAETLNAVIHVDPRRPRKLNPKVPADLEVIALHAMEKEIGRRYATVRALLQDLERFEEGRTITANAPSWSYQAWRLLKRHRASAIAACAVAVVGAIAFFVALLPYLQARQSLEHADDLFARGEFAAAAMLYESVLDSAVESEAIRCVDQLAKCLIATAPTERQRDPAGFLARAERCRARGCEALDLPLNVPVRIASAHDLRPPAWAPEATLLVEIGLARAAVSGTVPDVAPFTHAASLYGLEDSKMRVGGSDGLRNFGVRKVLDRLTPTLSDHESPTYGTAVAWLHTLLPFGKVKTLAGWASAQPPAIHGKLTRPLFTTLARGGVDAEGIADAFLLTPGPGIPAELARIAADGAFSHGDRLAAARTLALIGALPVLVADASGRNQIQEVLDLWGRIADTSRADGWRIRTRHALATEAVWWLERFTGGPQGLAMTDWVRWWSEHQNADPSAALMKRLGMTKMPSDRDARTLLARLDGEPQLAGNVHALLTLAEAGGGSWLRVPPRTHLSGWVAAWRRITDRREIQGRPGYRLFAGWFARDHCTWLAQALREDEYHALRDDVVVSSESALVPPTLETSVGVRVPGTTVPLSAPRQRRTELTWEAGMTADGLQAGIAKALYPTYEVGGRDSSRGSRFGRLSLLPGHVISPRIELYPSKGTPFLLQCFVLIENQEAVTSTGGGSSSGMPGAWALADWQRRLAEDLDRLADLLESGAADQDRAPRIRATVEHQVALALMIPDPVLRPALARLAGLTSGMTAQRIDMARLLVEDPEVISVPDLRERFTTDAVNQHRPLHSDAGFAVQILATCADPRPRALAYDILKSRGSPFVEAPVREHLAALELAQRIEDAPDWVAARMGRHGGGWNTLRHDPMIGILAFLPYLVAALGLLLAPRRRTRGLAGAVIASAGLVGMLMSVPSAGTELLPLPAALGLVALGMLVVGLTHRGYAPFIAVALCAAAAVVDPRATGGQLVAVFLVPGVLSTFATTLGQGRKNPGVGAWINAMHPLLAAGLFFVVSFSAPALTTDSVLWASLLAMAAWALLVLFLPARQGDRASPGSPHPLPLPCRIMLVAYAVPILGLNMAPELELPMDVQVWFYAVVGAATLWLCGRLLRIGFRAPAAAT